MKKLKTSTLCTSSGDPVTVVCPGHVDAKTFNQAFKNEGWSERGSYSKDDIKYIYGIFVPKKDGEFTFKMCSPTKVGAKKFTWTSWD